MIIKIYEEQIECAKVIKKDNKVIVLDENGGIIREDSGITNFESYVMVEGEWTEEVETPTTDERMTALEEENSMLKAQIHAQSEQMDFYEDCIAEMASVVYA